MLALEGLGVALEIGSIYPPLTSLRHEHISRLCAPIRYAPPQKILRIWEKNAKTTGKWPQELVDRHERRYGQQVRAEQRARNALYFADLFARHAVDHFHVHFANRAAHTALFLKEVSGIPFSVTAHGQDFMKDLGNDDLLREICAAAEFVAAETDYSRELLCQRCPDSAAKIHRVYNGIDLERFPDLLPSQANAMPRIISVGRLVAFKGFEHLIDACAELARRGLDFTCEIIAICRYLRARLGHRPPGRERCFSNRDHRSDGGCASGRFDPARGHSRICRARGNWIISAIRRYDRADPCARAAHTRS
jgi:glycosyltransferase involved in cell wall biosynthesis